MPSLIEPWMLSQVVVEIVYAFPTDKQVGTIRLKIIRFALYHKSPVDLYQLSLGLIDYY